MNEEERLDGIWNEYLQIFIRSFKGLHWHDSGYAWPNFHAELAEDNKYYKDSDYYYDLSQNKHFVHFTSLPRLFSIISEKAIRLYSLTNSNDEEEYEHTGKILNSHNEWRKYAKENSFTFSFCEPSELYNQDLWESYADHHRGCCIEFEIVNDPQLWSNYHLTDVKYEYTEDFVKFQREIDLLKQKFPAANFHSELGRLMIFRKSSRWLKEKEIRLATYTADYYGRYGKKTKDIRSEMRFSDEKDFRLIDFEMLPIAVKQPDEALNELFKKSPQIRIKRRADIIFHT